MRAFLYVQSFAALEYAAAKHNNMLLEVLNRTYTRTTGKWKIYCFRLLVFLRLHDEWFSPISWSLYTQFLNATLFLWLIDILGRTSLYDRTECIDCRQEAQLPTLSVIRSQIYIMCAYVNDPHTIPWNCNCDGNEDSWRLINGFTLNLRIS